MKQFESNSMVSKQNLLEWSGVPRRSFYYKRSESPRGRKPSETTITTDGELVSNNVVMQKAEAILQQEFCCNGYKNVWDALKEHGYIINHKKVYRLRSCIICCLIVRLVLLAYPGNLFVLEKSKQQNRWNVYGWTLNMFISTENTEMRCC